MGGRRVLITGASGSGTTTLGRSLAGRLSVPHADVDDYYWRPTTPPYVEKRDIDQRLRLMRAMFLGRDAWVLSGSVTKWGDPIVELLDLAVLLVLNPSARLTRLEQRELTRYGSDIEVGGPQHAAHQKFMDWAAGYDLEDFDGRNEWMQREWLQTLPCPVLELDSGRDLETLTAAVEAALQ